MRRRAEFTWRALACVTGTVCSLSAPASDIVVCRVGDGAASLSTAATAVFLERRASDGNLSDTIVLPTSTSDANQPFALAGTATSEGALAVSADGRYVTLAGYASAPGATAIAATTSASVNRVIARIDASGNIDTSSRFDTAFSANGVRAASSADGSAFWVSGNGTLGTGGVWYLTLGTTGGTQILGTPANVRIVNIFAGQLFGSSGSGTFTNVFTIGSGLPTMAGQTATSLAGLPTSTASPYSFVFFDRTAAVAGVDTLYIADDRGTAIGGGIQKWTFDGSSWNLSTTLSAGLSSGVRGLTGEAIGANVVLYATTTESVANNLVRVVDDGSVSPQATIIATAPTNTLYRGVTLAWVMPITDVIFKDGLD